MLLLAAELPDPKSAESTGWLFINAGTIVITVYYVLLVWKMLFPAKTPPDHETYATKAEVSKLEQEHEEEMERIESRFEGWMEQQAKQHTESMTELRKALNAFGEWQMTIERALGHVETKADLSLQQKAQRK